MKKKNKKKIIIIIVSSVVAAIVLALAIPFTIFGIRSASLNVAYSYLRTDPLYSHKVEVTGMNLANQHISCGYASIEMMSDYYGSKVTEDELEAKNGGRISTSTSRGFLREINNSIPSKSFIMHTYLHHDILLKEVCLSLKNNNPVAIEWAAMYEGAWTLHFSVVSALDLANDSVTVYNPYGYIENITVDEFISRTSFSPSGSISFFMSFGFAYGAFHKNTLFFAN